MMSARDGDPWWSSAGNRPSSGVPGTLLQNLNAEQLYRGTVTHREQFRDDDTPSQAPLDQQQRWEGARKICKQLGIKNDGPPPERFSTEIVRLKEHDDDFMTSSETTADGFDDEKDQVLSSHISSKKTQNPVQSRTNLYYRLLGLWWTNETKRTTKRKRQQKRREVQ